MSLTRYKLPVMLGVALMHALGSAQVLRDPMAPPAAAGLPMLQADRPVDVTAPPVIQIRKLGPVQKNAAIGGKSFQAGEQFGSWRVVRITADGVVLQTNAGSRSIPVQPVVKKNVVSGMAPASPPKNGKP